MSLKLGLAYYYRMSVAAGEVWMTKLDLEMVLLLRKVYSHHATSGPGRKAFEPMLYFHNSAYKMSCFLFSKSHRSSSKIKIPSAKSGRLVPAKAEIYIIPKSRALQNTQSPPPLRN